MRRLVVISETYPYGIGEEFLFKELKEASTLFDQILIYPLLKSEDRRQIPTNCTVINIFNESEVKSSLIRNFWTIINVLRIELLKGGKAWQVVKMIREQISIIRKCLMFKGALVNDLRSREQAEDLFYSVWMNNGGLTLALAMREGSISNASLRLHGYELFDERREGNYMPFRAFNFKHMSSVFVLSLAGKVYLADKGWNSEKIIHNYSGLYDHGIGPFDSQATFHIVSCSNLHAFKRVDLIAKSLQDVEFPVIWTHFGDGKELESVMEEVKKLPDSVKIEIKGRVPNPELINFYQSNSVNLFVHLSTTEGLGMSAVEAQSFGIPALSVDVGGVKEVVNEKTGILIEKNQSPIQVGEYISNFKSSSKNSEEFRQQVRNHFLENFEAQKNYKYFFDRMRELASHPNSSIK